MTEVRMRDFSRKVRALEFHADGDDFRAFSDIPPYAMQEVLAMVKDGALMQDLTQLATLFERLLEPDSALLMRQRLDNRTIGINQVLDIVTWLTEEYAQRPTQPSVISSPGSQTDSTGTSSMDGVQNEE